MPYKTSSQESLTDAQAVVNQFHIESEIVDITRIVDGYFGSQPEASSLRRGNAMARARMIVLFDKSMEHRALVLGTSNKTELLLGYGTLYGDMASAINPIGDLYKTDIFQLAAYLEVPESILKKKPTADLWAGQSDEEELGFTYAAVDELLHEIIDRRSLPEKLVQTGFDEAFVHKMVRKIQGSQFKRRGPVICKLSPRSVTHDSTICETGDCRLRHGRNALCGRHANRQPGRHHAASAARAARGGPDRVRGYPAHRKAARTLRHSEANDELP